MNTKIMIAIVLSVIPLLISGQSIFAKDSSNTNYNNGFNSGLTDCNIPEAQWSMNTASNAGHHSQAFLDGHAAGLAACQGHNVETVSNQNSNNVDQNNRNQPQGQTAANNNHCFVLIGSCGAPGINQGQSLNN